MTPSLLWLALAVRDGECEGRRREALLALYDRVKALLDEADERPAVPEGDAPPAEPAEPARYTYE